MAAVALGLLAAKELGLFDRLRDPAALARSLVDLGGWGYAAFILAYAILQPFGVPGTVFIVAAPLIWPWPVAFALSMVGTMAASVIGFTFYRFLARDWVASRIPPQFKKYEDAIERRGFATVVLLRFIFWMPPPLHAFFAVSKVKPWTHFWGSLVGYIVPLLVVSYFGQRVFDWMKGAPASVWIGAGVAVGAIAAGVWGWTRWKSARVRTGS
ncbi:MAG TPA: VTT domain-containing protein [Polyangiaceae bacterium]